jgi:hypothetical protein
MFYVYLHLTEDTNEVFYVGKGKGNRAYKLSGRNKFWHSVVNKHGFVVKIVEDNLSEDQSVLLERKLISEYGRRDLGQGTLVNLTDGGEGQSGKIYSDKERLVLSEKAKSYYEIPEHIEKRKLIAKEVNGRPEVKEKLRLRAIEQNCSEEFRKIKAENTKNSWNDPEVRRRRSEKIKQTRSSEESRNKTILRNQKTYVGFISPTGEIYSPVINLTKFCKQHKLSTGCMYRINSGELSQHKGWKKYIPAHEVV